MVRHDAGVQLILLLRAQLLNLRAGYLHVMRSDIMTDPIFQATFGLQISQHQHLIGLITPPKLMALGNALTQALFHGDNAEGASTSEGDAERARLHLAPVEAMLEGDVGVTDTILAAEKQGAPLHTEFAGQPLVLLNDAAAFSSANDAQHTAETIKAHFKQGTATVLAAYFWQVWAAIPLTVYPAMSSRRAGECG